jgi:flagellar basal-body rod protein FlgB
MDKIFGISEQAIKLTEDRSVMLTNNLVNSSTPHYKAKDIDFHKVLQAAGGGATTMSLTNAGHMAPEQMDGARVQYRVPMQTSLDGNTVDEELERKNFLENSLNYQVNLTFIQNKTHELLKAIKGE